MPGPLAVWLVTEKDTTMGASHAVLEFVGGSTTSQLPAVPVASRRLDEAAKIEIDRLHRRGVSADALADQFAQTRSRIDRVLTEMRARRLQDYKLDYMHDPSFEQPGAEAVILAPMPESARGKVRRSKPPEG